MPVRSSSGAPPPSSRPFQKFLKTEVAGGLLLLICSIGALLIANSPWASLYVNVWEIHLVITAGDQTLNMTLHEVVNDGLMAIFFLLVGLEIKRELLAGELASVRRATLPIAAALGGMVVPALIYFGFTAGTPEVRGWGIPMATDIAFALGALSIVAPRAPVGAKVFLAALAIVDDIGAVLVIALFYTSTLQVSALAGALGVLAVMIGLNQLGVRQLAPYLLLGVGLWLLVHASGVHSTIAGVLLAFTIPTRTRMHAPEFSREARDLLAEFDRTTSERLILTNKRQQEALFALERTTEWVTAPLLRLEHRLHGLTAFGIMPLFAFANAGVTFAGATPDTSIVLGSALGLMIGKPLGITAAAYLAVVSGRATLPTNLGWTTLHACAWLGGIGFTMSLFISGLAFADPAMLDSAKMGVLGGSAASGMLAALIIRLATDGGATRAAVTPA